MPRILGDTPFSQNYEVAKAGPLDARLWTPNYSELTGSTEFGSTYAGMIVSVYGDVTPSNNGVYYYNGSGQTNINNWIKLSDSKYSTLTITGGTGISAATNGNVVTVINTAPDQTVSLSGGTNISITGTYPNFGVSATGSSITSGSFGGDKLTLSGSSSPVIIPQLSENVLYNAGLSSSLSTAYTVGGLAAGTPLTGISGTTIINLLNNILFPRIQPTVSSPTYSLGAIPSSGLTVNTNAYNNTIFSINGVTYNNSLSTNVGNILVEMTTGNTVYNIGLTGGFNSGGIYLNGIYQLPRSGNAYDYTFSGQSLTLHDNGNNITYNTTFIPRFGLNSFISTVFYYSGSTPLDSYGVAATSYTALPAGSMGVTNSAIEGVYPIYSTTSSITNMDKTLVSLTYRPSTVKLNLAAETGGNLQKVWIPRNLINTDTISISHEYNNAFGSNAIETTAWTQSATTINGILYWLYTYNGGTRGAISIQITL